MAAWKKATCEMAPLEHALDRAGLKSTGMGTTQNLRHESHDHQTHDGFVYENRKPDGQPASTVKLPSPIPLPKSTFILPVKGASKHTIVWFLKSTKKVIQELINSILAL